MTSRTPYPLLTAIEIEKIEEKKHIHQFNDNAVRLTKSLGDHLGLETIGIHLVRLETGRESTQFHTHQCDEEFILILSGRGLAEIDDKQHEVTEGDFMAFTRNSLPHSMMNPFAEDLVYLMGGTRSEIDICDYPRIKRRMYRVDGNKEYVDWKDLNKI